MSEAPLAGLRAIVYGRVQGVSFRVFVQRRALELGLRGIARNRNDGRSVEVIAEGTKPALEALLASLKQGPPGARVEKVDAGWPAPTGAYDSFVTG